VNAVFGPETASANQEPADAAVHYSVSQSAHRRCNQVSISRDRFAASLSFQPFTFLETIGQNSTILA